MGFFFLIGLGFEELWEPLQPPQICAAILVRIRLAGIGDKGVGKSWRDYLAAVALMHLPR